MSQNLENTAENPDQGQNISEAQEKAVDSFVSASSNSRSRQNPLCKSFQSVDEGHCHCSFIRLYPGPNQLGFWL